MGNTLASVAGVLEIGEKLSIWMACIILICCLVFSLLMVLGLCIGLGYNYCFIDAIIRYKYASFHNTYRGSPRLYSRMTKPLSLVKKTQITTITLPILFPRGTGIMSNPPDVRTISDIEGKTNGNNDDANLNEESGYVQTSECTEDCSYDIDKQVSKDLGIRINNVLARLQSRVKAKSVTESIITNYDPNFETELDPMAMALKHTTVTQPDIFRSTTTVFLKYTNKDSQLLKPKAKFEANKQFISEGKAMSLKPERKIVIENTTLTYKTKPESITIASDTQLYSMTSMMSYSMNPENEFNPYNQTETNTVTFEPEKELDSVTISKKSRYHLENHNLESETTSKLDMILKPKIKPNRYDSLKSKTKLSHLLLSSIRIPDLKNSILKPKAKIDVSIFKHEIKRYPAIFLPDTPIENVILRTESNIGYDIFESKISIVPVIGRNEDVVIPVSELDFISLISKLKAEHKNYTLQLVPT